MGTSDLQRFGGSWTDAKLGALNAYLQAYTTALKNQPFRKLYIDAFAGTGYRELREKPSDSTPLFEELAAEESQRFLDGSARIALQSDPPFDEFIFIESAGKRASELRKLQLEFSSKKIDVRKGDANEQIHKLCTSTNWRNTRAVVFLDPYGMQVDWVTMLAIAKTQGIDTWILFPLGIGVNRLLTDDFKNIPAKWKERLDRMLGTADWKDEFYQKTNLQGNLFEQRPSNAELKNATFESIGRYYHGRLKSIFSHVAPNPKDLCNSTGNPIYQLHFAANNPRGGPIAMRIAKHILNKV
jgi:three-Cys-motif partner protein